MTKITRYTGNVQPPASNAVGTERTIFGGITQADDLDSNLNADLLRGWGIVPVNGNPTKQDFNAMGFTLGQLIAYLHQVGVAEWDSAQEYNTGSYTSAGGTLYESMSDANIGNDPTTDDGTNWAQAQASYINGNAKLRDAAPMAGRRILRKYHTTDGDGGALLFRGITGAAPSTYVDNNGTIIVPTGGDGSAAWIADFSGVVNSAWFGFSPAATAAANKTALQAFVTYVCTNKRHGIIPDGDYTYAGEVIIPFTQGWAITGESIGGTKLIQDTDSTPHFRFDYENTHSFQIGNMTLSWTNQQTTADTGSIGLYFKGPAVPVGSGMYEFWINNIIFEKGFRSIQGNPTTALPVWGGNFRGIWHESTMCGGVVNLTQSTPQGQPNNKFEEFYVRAHNMASTEAVFNLQSCSNTEMHNIEVNNTNLGAKILIANTSEITIGAIKSEIGTWDTADVSLFELSDSIFNIDILRIQTSTINPGAGNYVSLFYPYGVKNKVNIGVLDVLWTTLTSGSFTVTKNGSSAHQIVIGSIYEKSNITLSNIVGTDAGSGLWVEEWERPRVSADNGDADLTLVMGDEVTQLFKTTLTADRVVTLPADDTNPCDTFNGAEFDIVRNAAVPGAFTLTIKNDAGGTIKAIPASTNAVVRVRYRRLAWELVGYETL